MRNIQDKTDGTGDILSAEAFNINFIDELQGIAVSAGFTLDVEAGPDTDTSMLSKSIVNYSVGAQFFAESGVADAYVLTRTGTLAALSSYFDGVSVIFKPGNTNTGASTINVDGLGVKDLVASDGSALTGSEVLANNYVIARYNSSSDDFEIIVGGYALDSTVVHLAGVEDITGIKTISGGLDIDNNVSIRFANFSGTDRTFLQLDASDQFQLGNATVPCYLRTDGNFYHNGNAVWDTGNDSDLAKLSATQTFTGVNTFAADVTIDSSTEADIFLDSGDYAYESRIFFRVAGVNRGYIGYINNATASSESLHFNVGGVSNEVLSIDGAGTLTLPETAETKIALTGANNPLISFSEGAVNKGYIRWMADGYMRIRNLEDTSEIRIKNDIEYSPNGSTLYTIYHEGNDSVLAHLAGAETFTGTKTFSGSSNFSGSSYFYTDIFHYLGAGSTNFLRFGHVSSTGTVQFVPYVASVSQPTKALLFNGTSQEWQIDNSNNYTIYHSGTSSASDTFTTADAKTVTVVNGLITSIV